MKQFINIIKLPVIFDAKNVPFRVPLYLVVLHIESWL